MLSKPSKPPPTDKVWQMEALVVYNTDPMASRLRECVGQPRRQGPSSKTSAALSIFLKRFKNCRRTSPIHETRSVTWI